MYLKGGILWQSLVFIVNVTKQDNLEELISITADGYRVAQHPKTDAGIRTLVLTPNAKKYIKMALDENKANGDVTKCNKKFPF